MDMWSWLAVLCFANGGAGGLHRLLEAAAIGVGQSLHRLAEGELRAAAQLLLQDVIDDFVPQIEAELKRRLDVRLDLLLSQRKP